MTRSKGLKGKKFLFSCLLLLTLILPSSVFVTSADQQGDFNVPFAGTATGSIPPEISLKVILIPEGQLNEVTSFVIKPESLKQEIQDENFIVSTDENLKVETDIRLIFQNDTETPSPIPEPPPSPCYFDPALEECQPVDGRCPPEFVFNENEQCIPVGKCPDGYGRLDDDETGKCYKNSDIKTCPDGYITHKNADCPRDELFTTGIFGKRNFSV